MGNIVAGAYKRYSGRGPCEMESTIGEYSDSRGLCVHFIGLFSRLRFRSCVFEVTTDMLAGNREGSWFKI